MKSWNDYFEVLVSRVLLACPVLLNLFIPCSTTHANVPLLSAVHFFIFLFIFLFILFPSHLLKEFFLLFGWVLGFFIHLLQQKKNIY